MQSLVEKIASGTKPALRGCGRHHRVSSEPSDLGCQGVLGRARREEVEPTLHSRLNRAAFLAFELLPTSPHRGTYPFWAGLSDVRKLTGIRQRTTKTKVTQVDCHHARSGKTRTSQTGR
jgi:hypothetical protein